MSISDSGLLKMWESLKGKKMQRKRKTVPAYNALPMFADRVWFVNENVILFPISKQYYINEIK